MKKTNQIILHSALAAGILLGGFQIWNISAQEDSIQPSEDLVETTQNTSAYGNGLRKRDGSCFNTSETISQNNSNCDGTQQRKHDCTNPYVSTNENRGCLRHKDGSQRNNPNCPR